MFPPVASTAVKNSAEGGWPVIFQACLDPTFHEGLAAMEAAGLVRHCTATAATTSSTCGCTTPLHAFSSVRARV